jgi:hypothetical protein
MGDGQQCQPAELGVNASATSRRRARSAGAIGAMPSGGDGARGR